MNFQKKKAFLLIRFRKIFKEKVKFIKSNYNNKKEIHNRMKMIILVIDLDLLKKLFRVCKNKE